LPPPQIEKLTREVVILLMRLSLLRPIEMRKFVAVSRQYHASEAEAFGMWRTVVQSMKLSDQQQQVRAAGLAAAGLGAALAARAGSCARATGTRWCAAAC
jgi:hypothetical protein